MRERPRIEGLQGVGASEQALEVEAPEIVRGGPGVGSAVQFGLDPLRSLDGFRSEPHVDDAEEGAVHERDLRAGKRSSRRVDDGARDRERRFPELEDCLLYT